MSAAAAVNAPFPEQRLTPDQALRCYTAGGAFASSEEERKGTLTAGKMADFVVLDRSPIRFPRAIENLRVKATAIGGRVVWRR